jgi:putative oxidoreductase
MDAGLSVLHVVVGLLLFGHGAQKLFGWFGGQGIGRAGGFMEALGLRPGRVHAVAGGLGEVVGGTLLTLGLLVPLGSALVIAVMVTATIAVHWSNGIWAQNGGFELPLTNIAVAFALAAVGAGDISLDAALDLDLAGTGWALAALGVGVLGGVGAVAQGRLAGRREAGATTARPAG